MPQQQAGQLVNNFLASLQKLDNTLISSLRSKTPVPDAADKEVEQAVQDLDRYELQNVQLFLLSWGYMLLHLPEKRQLKVWATLLLHLHIVLNLNLFKCACRLLATAPPQEIEKAQKLLDDVKAMFAEPPKSDEDVQALQQLIPMK